MSESGTTLECANCGAPKRQTRYTHLFRCEHCDTLHVPEALALDSLTLLDAPSEHRCPLGHGPLVHATADRWKLLACPTCRGLFIDGVTFWKLLEYRRASNREKPLTPRPVEAEALERRILCPACNERMDAHIYYGPGDFVIDSCNNCSSVWLDHGELTEAVRADWKPGW